MLFKLADNQRPDSLASQMRRQRMQLVLKLLEGRRPPIRILDVGGTPTVWRNMTGSLPGGCEITLLNITVGGDFDLPNVHAMIGDARKVSQFADGDYDVCFSNSVIEHMGTLYDQMAMAQEVQRVARDFFVQTPNRWFLIEPHFLVPGWQFLPRFLRAALLRRRRFGWMRREPDRMIARAEVEQVRLLTARELGWLFPRATIYLEKIGPFTKSLIAIGRG